MVVASDVLCHRRAPVQESKCSSNAPYLKMPNEEEFKLGLRCPQQFQLFWWGKCVAAEFLRTTENTENPQECFETLWRLLYRCCLPTSVQ